MTDMDMTNDESWGDYRKLVLAELERLSVSVAGLDKKFDAFRSDELSKMKVDIAMLQVKSGIWGGLAGGVAGILYILMRR